MILFIILFVIFLFFIYNFLFRIFWTKRLYIHFQFSEKELFEGQKITLNETIINHKLLPLPFLQLSFALSKHFRFIEAGQANVSDASHVKNIFSLSFYHKEERSFQITCEKRGIYTLDTLHVSTRNLFTRDRYRISFPIIHTVVVFPKPLSPPKLQNFWQTAFGEAIHRKFDPEDPFSFRGIREYQPIDSMHKINWKSTAKTGQLMVNQFFSATTRRICLLLDTDRTESWKSEALVEECIRLTSSLSEKMISQSYSVTMISNAADQNGDLCFPMQTSFHDLSLLAIRYGLAKIDLSMKVIKNIKKSGWLDIPQESDSVYVLISARQDQGAQISEFKHKFKQKGNIYLQVIEKPIPDSLTNNSIMNTKNLYSPNDIFWEVQL